MDLIFRPCAGTGVSGSGAIHKTCLRSYSRVLPGFLTFLLASGLAKPE
jgi:hypothetical protein